MPVGIFPMPDSEIRAGKLADWDALSFSVKSNLTLDTDTGDGDPTYSHTEYGNTLYAPNAVDLLPGIEIAASSSFNGTSGTWYVYYNGPCAPFGGWTMGGSVYRSDVEIEIRLRGLKLYCMETGALLRIMFSAVEVWVNGALEDTLGPAVDATSAGVGPNYVPFVGIPLRVYRSCTADRANLTPWTYDPCDPDNADGRDWETAVSQTGTGGWRWRETSSGDWIDAPVSPYTGSATRTYGDLLSGTAQSAHQFGYEGRTFLNTIYEYTCGVEEGEVDPGPIGGGTAPGVGIDPCTGELGPAYADVYRTANQSHSEGDGNVLLIPNLDRSLDRLATDYAKLLRRLWFPETRATTSESETVDGVTSSTADVVTVHPSLGDDFLGLLRDADHEVLDFLDHPAYAPSSTGSSDSDTVTYSSYGTETMQCPPPGASGPTGSCPGTGVIGTSCATEPFMPDDTSTVSSSSVAFPTYVGASGDYQGHAEAIARYCATWPNPFWHLFDHRQDWYLQGSNAPWAPVDEDTPGYWGPVRDQLLYNADLPSGEQANTRSAMIGSPYYDWFATPFFDEFTSGLPWTGTTRFKVREVEFPEEAALTDESEPMLSSPDESCTIAVSGGTITLTPTGSGTITLDIDLVRADCFPFYGLLLAKTVKFTAWSNVDELRAALRSSFGGSVDFNSGNPLAIPTEYAFPRGTDAGYAGTWGLDEGVGYLTDQGTDVAPGGDSIGHMANPETVAGFQGIRGLQGSVLRLTIEPSGAGDVTLSLPTFRRFQGHPVVRWLDGNKAVLLWPDGPAILWGAHLTYVPDVGLHWPWLPKALGTCNSLADVLQFAYATFEMTDPGDVSAFDAECNAWYDDFEVSLRNVGSADKFSFSFLLPKGSDETIRFAICQTVAEVPPLANFPFGERGTNDWQADGDPVMQRFDQAQEIKYIVSPGNPLVLQNPSGGALSSADSAPAGWAIQRYVLALTGDEADDYRLAQGGTLIARIYPWRGWDWVGGPYTLSTGGLALLDIPDGSHWRAAIEDDALTVRVAIIAGPKAGWATVYAFAGTEDASNPCLTWDSQNNRAYLTFDGDGGIYESYSDDDGETWSTPTLSEVIPGGRVCRWRHDADGNSLYTAIVDDAGSGAGKLVGRYRAYGDLDFGTQFDLTIHMDSAIDPSDVLRVDGDADAPTANYDHFPGQVHDGRWNLALYRPGDSGPSDWFSVDDGKLWKPAS